VTLALTISLAVGNIIIGLAYTGYGAMTLIEMIRDRSTRGFSHFGAAWIAMAFTCGPHHWVHGIHLAFEGRVGGGLDLFAVVFGLPAGLIWFYLRVEAFSGGRGDRFIPGNPFWVLALPTVLAMYLTALVAAALGVGGLTFDASNLPLILPNLMLVVFYGAIGYFLARTQLANHKPLGGWSLSGLALTVVFPTCALMHAVYALYGASGTYAPDIHGLGIDLVAVPAAAYFLWVVQGLYRGTFRDWNGVPPAVKEQRSGPATAGHPAVG
jgi:hypothetical protein